MSELPWSEPVRLSEVGRGSQRRVLTADTPTRRRVAQTLGLSALEELTAEVELAPWVDGAVVRAEWRARITQICGVTLEPFESSLSGSFEVRAVPADSPHAPAEDGVLELDLEAEDPPDMLEADNIDPAAYVVEHLALELDPFPRKPDAVFEPLEAEPEASPFAALLALKPQS